MEESKYNRASFDEVLNFCNAVREAGGANPLDALLPAVPSDSTSCLIARNLNFSCTVTPSGDHYQAELWYMEIDDPQIVETIIDNVDGAEPFVDLNGRVYATRVLLPPEIAQVAIEFDRWEVSEVSTESDPAFLEFIQSDYIEVLEAEGII
jgi:hypothetical protein